MGFLRLILGVPPQDLPGHRHGDWPKVQVVRKLLTMASWALTFAHPECQAQVSHMLLSG